MATSCDSVMPPLSGWPGGAAAQLMIAGHRAPLAEVTRVAGSVDDMTGTDDVVGQMS
jgi:hypothetical protein